MSEKPENKDSSQKTSPKTSDEILTELSHKIEVEKQARTPKKHAEPDQGRALGMRIASDFFAGIFFGLLVGYYMDQWLETAPFAMITMTFLGFGAGIRNAMRSSDEFAERLAQQKRDQTQKQSPKQSPKESQAESPQKTQDTEK